MDFLVSLATQIVLIAGGLLIVANLVCACLRIYLDWPRRR
jgi:hypothetical protein